MKKTRLIWHLFPAFLAVVIAALLAVALYTAHFFHEFYYNQLSNNLKIRAQFTEYQIGPIITNPDNFTKIDRVCKELASKSSTRITIILPDGRVIGDSDEEPAVMQDHSDRPEFKEAVREGLGKSVRFSNTLGRNMMYLAIPMKRENKIIAIVRTSVPVEIIDGRLAELYKKIIWAGIAIAVCAAVLSWRISRKITRPIEQMKEAAQHFAGGDFERRVAPSKTIELDLLAKALNEMAEQMSGRIETITKDKNETQALLSRMSQLEKVRRDFVANVSHELKTPITSIKGFVETLLEGAVKDPQQIKRFLEIIAKHSDRLDAIINDLLALSRLEEESEKRNLSFDEQYLKPVLISAMELAKIKAEQKHVTLRLDCDETVKAKINSPLIEQAVLNLIDNAIKYSQENGQVHIAVQKTGAEILIAVKDHGCGIEQQHLSRIFERFYVVDKARSRKLGGTGLGLSIVKHISQVHKGSVSVESNPDKGSSFTIHLPTA